MSAKTEARALASELQDIYRTQATWLDIAHHILDYHNQNGTPIAWEEVEIGDRVRAVFNETEFVVVSKVAIITAIDTNWLQAGESGGESLFIHRTDTDGPQLFLLHRPEVLSGPTKLTDLEQGVVADVAGRQYPFNGQNAYYTDVATAAPGQITIDTEMELRLRPWRQVKVSTPVDGVKK